MLGIVVGIASVIAMLAIGAGSQASIESSIQSAGSNLLTVSPSSGGQSGPGARSAASSVESLSLEDAEALGEPAAHHRCRPLVAVHGAARG